MVATALTALASSELYLQRGNVLHDNPRWLSSKVELEKGVVAGATYVVTRRALAGNRLNLGSWFGYQEIVLRDSLSAASVAFDVHLVGAAVASMWT